MKPKNVLKRRIQHLRISPFKLVGLATRLLLKCDKTETLHPKNEFKGRTKSKAGVTGEV